MEQLLKIQSELKVPKDLFNKFGNYRYRSCESILEALKPLLKKHKCTLTLSDKIVEFSGGYSFEKIQDGINETTNINGRIYVEATATLKDIESTESESTTALAREPAIQKGMNDAQITGSASSYARKYALNGLFAIDDTKEDDYTNKHETKKAVNKTSVQAVATSDRDFTAEADECDTVEQLNTWIITVPKEDRKIAESVGKQRKSEITT